MGRAARLPRLTTALAMISRARVPRLTAPREVDRVERALSAPRSSACVLDAESIAHDMRTGDIISCLVALGSTGYEHDAALVDVLDSELQDRPTWAPTT